MHLLRGATLTAALLATGWCQFQFIHPMRDVTLFTISQRLLWYIISIHTPHAGCNHLVEPDSATNVISIHASLAGCNSGFCPHGIFSIHAPRMRCNTSMFAVPDSQSRFQFIYLMLYATMRSVRHSDTRHFNSCTSCDVQYSRALVSRKDYSDFNSCTYARCNSATAGCSGLHPYFNSYTPCGV